MNRKEQLKTWSNNCVTLANFLLNEVADDAHDQRVWSISNENNACGTVGCALGWSVAAGIVPGKFQDMHVVGKYLFPDLDLENKQYGNFYPTGSTWDEAGINHFGLRCYRDVFLNTTASKKETIQALFNEAERLCNESREEDE